MPEEPRDILHNVMLDMAAGTADPNEKLHDLEAAFKLRPNEELARAIASLRVNLVAGPTYVAVEQARILGRRNDRIIGNVFVLQEDGSLKPASGSDLIKLNERHPHFIRDWRLNED